MTKPHIRLRLVERPLGPLTRAEKLVRAIAFLRSRGKYVMDKGAAKPAWGIPFAQQEESPLMRSVMEADRRRR